VSRGCWRRSIAAGAGLALALTVAACGSSGPGSSSGTTQAKDSTTSSSSLSGSSTTAPASTTTSTPTVAVSLPVIVCNTTAGAPTTTTSLPASVSVNVPPSDAQQGNLAVYSDASGRLLLVGPTVGWTCTGNFGADGSGMMALTPVGTTVPANTSTTWHLTSSSPVQAIVALESGASTVQAAALACPLFAAAKTAVQEDLGKECAASPEGEHAVPSSSSEVSFRDPPGVAGVGVPSGGQNAANGVMLYLPKSSEASAYLATCTLPAAQESLCAAVLSHFVATFG
jgi:hypothetical protein